MCCGQAATCPVAPPSTSPSAASWSASVPPPLSGSPAPRPSRLRRRPGGGPRGVRGGSALGEGSHHVRMIVWMPGSSWLPGWFTCSAGRWSCWACRGAGFRSRRRWPGRSELAAVLPVGLFMPLGRRSTRPRPRCESRSGWSSTSGQPEPAAALGACRRVRIGVLARRAGRARSGCRRDRSAGSAGPGPVMMQHHLAAARVGHLQLPFIADVRADHALVMRVDHAAADRRGLGRPGRCQVRSAGGDRRGQPAGRVRPGRAQQGRHQDRSLAAR
jgi:hypothetical protein